MTDKNAVPTTPPTTPPTDFTDTLKIAGYGRYGSRKTLQIGHLIELVGPANVLVVSAEHGLGTIRSKVDPANVITVTNYTDVRANWKTVAAFAAPDRWICMDGASQVMEWIANEQFAGADRYFDAKARGLEIKDADKPFGRFMSDKGSIDAMRIYGRIGRDSELFLSSWIGLPCNLYFNYLEDMTQSSGYEKTIPWGPDVPGKVGLRSVMSSFDFVFRLTFNADGKLTAGFNPASNVYLARTREDRTLVNIPTEITDFNLAEFVTLVTQQKSVPALTAVG
jgi:hypothetical protein